MLDLVAGALSPNEADVANAHLESCQSCQSWVAMVARVEAPPPTITQSEVADTSAGLERGGTLGQYEIQQRVGSGGMSHVYAALDRQLGRTVALKVLRADLAADAGTRSRLVTEAQAMARLSHPNVVTVYEAKELDGVLYLAMEFVEGVTLSRWLRAGRRSLSDILQAFAQAGRGLSAAHAAGIIHRDFKPHNVLMGTDGRARVTDFGIARWQQSAPGTGVTQVGQFVGTPAYSSPEQMLGLTLDTRSDQFSFCVALYEALYDRRPFAGTSFTEVSKAMREGIIDSARGSFPVTSRLHRVVLRGLSPAPEARFASMGELLAELAKAQSASRAVVWIGAAAVLAALAAFVAVRAMLPPQVPGPSVEAARVEPVKAEPAAVAGPAPQHPVDVEKAPPMPLPDGDARAEAPSASSPTRPAAAIAARPLQHPHAAPKKQTANRLSEADAPPEDGRLTIVLSGLGFAEVFVDDEKTPRGRVPCQTPFELSAGPHRIRLQRAGEVLDDQHVNISPGAAQTLSGNVERR